MENSIEEDIKILEEFKTNGYSILLMKYGDRIKTNFKLEKAIEHLLSDYKRVLKENEELKEENEYNKLLLELNNNFTIDKKTGNYKWNVIEIQKIKDKIEELKQKAINYGIFIDKDESFNIESKISVLQELLEESEE